MAGAQGAKDGAGRVLAIGSVSVLGGALAIYAVAMPLVLALAVRAMGLSPMRPALLGLGVAMVLLGPAVAALVGPGGVAAVARALAEPGGDAAEIVVRLFVPGVLLVYFLALAAAGAPSARLLPLIALDVAAALYGWVLFTHLMLRASPSPLRRMAAMLSDVALVSMFLHFGAALAVPWFSLYFLIVFGFGGQSRALASAAAATLAGFAAVWATTPYWRAQPALAGGIVLSLLLLPAHLRTLARRPPLAPAAGPRAPLAQATPKPVPPRAARPLDLLLAAKESAGRAALAGLLETAGHRVTMAESGEAALSLLGRERFDLALVDIDLPEMSGCDLARLYRLEHLGEARLPIVALAAATGEARARCRDAGIDAVLAEPLDATPLLAAIEDVHERLAAPAAVALVPAPDGGASEPGAVLDAGVIAALRSLGAGGDFLDELATAFSADARQLLGRLREAASAGDAPGFERVIGALRSSAVNIGAARLAETLATLRHIGGADLGRHGARYLDTLQGEVAAFAAALGAMARESGRSY